MEINTPPNHNTTKLQNNYSIRESILASQMCPLLFIVLGNAQ
jgi:hypothetical protein